MRRLIKFGTDAELQAALDGNVLDYLRRPVSEGGASPSLSPLVLHPEDSLGTAIELLAATHRWGQVGFDQVRLGEYPPRQCISHEEAARAAGTPLRA